MYPNKNWYETFFQGVAADLWERAMPPEWTLAEVSFLERNLNLKLEARVLDVPCGNGRHGIELARRGYRVTGFDISTDFLQRAKQHAAAAGVTIELVQGDMKHLPDIGLFDAAYCFGNSFGYLDPPSAETFLHGVAQRLPPGGRLVIDTGAMAETILPHAGEQNWYEFEGLYMLSRNEYDAAESRMDIEYTFIKDGVTDRRLTSTHVLTCRELCQMLGRAGFSVESLFKSIDGEPFEPGADRLLAVAVR